MSTASLIQMQPSVATLNFSSSGFSKHSYLALPPPAFLFSSQSYGLINENKQKQNIALFVGRRCRMFAVATQDETAAEEAEEAEAAAVEAEEAEAEAATTTRKPISEYLVERLGFSEEHSVAACRKLQLRRKRFWLESVNLISCENAENVIGYFQDENECGLDQYHIKEIIRKFPSILTADVDKTIKPKIKILQDLGFSTSDLAHVLSAHPGLYLKRDLSPAIQAFRDIMGSDKEGLIKLMKRLTRVSTNSVTNNLIPNVDMLENEYGIPRDKLTAFLTKSPECFLRKTEWLRDVLVKIEDKWGISREDSTEFLSAMRVFCGISDEIIDLKCQLFRNYGWTESDVRWLMRKDPRCFAYSEARLKKLLEFYTNELGFKPDYMADRPGFFSFSLENRVLPRCRVLSILKERGLIKASYKLYSSLLLTDAKFFHRLIEPHENVVPNLRELYINGKTLDEVPLHM